MSVRQFTWTWPKILVVIAHLADQTRYSSVFSGQNHEDAYSRDIAYYNNESAFSTMEISKRHLHGKDGIYSRIYGHAEALRSQLIANGRDSAIGQLTYKLLGISTVTMIRDGLEFFQSTKLTAFNQLIQIANEQLETTSDPSRMTRHERVNYDKLGD
jgi:hypothetical protein